MSLDESAELAQRIKQARLKAGLTQAQIAELMGCTRGAITQWESENPNIRTSPPIPALKRFVGITQTSIFSLLGSDEMNELLSAAHIALHAIDSKSPFDHFDNVVAPLLRSALNKQGTHAPGCWAWGPGHHECALAEIKRLNRQEQIRAKFDEESG